MMKGGYRQRIDDLEHSSAKMRDAIRELSEAKAKSVNTDDISDLPRIKAMNGQVDLNRSWLFLLYGVVKERVGVPAWMVVRCCRMRSNEDRVQLR